MLASLLAHGNRVVSRGKLIELARGRDADPFDRSIDVRIAGCARSSATMRAARASSRRFTVKVMSSACSSNVAECVAHVFAR